MEMLDKLPICHHPYHNAITSVLAFVPVWNWPYLIGLCLRIGLGQSGQCGTAASVFSPLGLHSDPLRLHGPGHHPGRHPQQLLLHAADCHLLPPGGRCCITVAPLALLLPLHLQGHLTLQALKGVELEAPTYASEPQRRVRDFCVSLSDLSELRRALNFLSQAGNL